jgi:hypothetical protein
LNNDLLSPVVCTDFRTAFLNAIVHANIRLNISLEMPGPSQGHYGFHSFPIVD